MGGTGVVQKRPHLPAHGPPCIALYAGKSRSVHFMSVCWVAIAGNRVGCLGHARGQPTQLKTLLARAQVELHLLHVDA